VEGSSRIEQARRRLRVARVSIGATAAAGFLVFALAARVSHPGTHHTQVSTNSAATSDDSQFQSDDFGFGSGSISPSTGAAPTLRSGGS
jgi:hypothetical protein